MNFSTPTAVVLVTLIFFIIIGLDRPTRGLIQINQAAMLELQQQPPD